MWVYEEKAVGCLAPVEAFSLKTYLKQLGRWNDVPDKTKTSPPEFILGKYSEFMVHESGQDIDAGQCVNFKFTEIPANKQQIVVDQPKFDSLYPEGMKCFTIRKKDCFYFIDSKFDVGVILPRGLFATLEVKPERAVALSNSALANKVLPISILKTKPSQYYGTEVCRVSCFGVNEKYNPGSVLTRPDYYYSIENDFKCTLPLMTCPGISDYSDILQALREFFNIHKSHALGLILFDGRGLPAYWF